MKENRGVKIAKLSLKILFGVVILAFIALFIMSKVTSSPIFLFKRTTMWVLTESMDPTIPPKTYILVEKATADDVEVGDIIVFRSDDPRIKGQFNAHRLISKTDDVMVTKGDNNKNTDGAYSAKADAVVGKYVKSLPAMTFLGRVVMTPAGYAVLVLVFIATIVICVIPDVKDAVRVKEESDEEEKQKEIRRLIEEEKKRLKESGLEPSSAENGEAHTAEIISKTERTDASEGEGNGSF